MTSHFSGNGPAGFAWPEGGLAFVVLREGATLDEEAVKAHARGMLSRYKIPRRFVQVRSLPRTLTGKVQKYRLRQGPSDPIG